MCALYDKNFLLQKAEKYCLSINSNLIKEIGHGLQGVVYQTSLNTAIKVYDLEAGYKREQSVYRRLDEKEIFSVMGLTIPRIKNFDDNLLIIEMSIVHVPCIPIAFGFYSLSEKPKRGYSEPEVNQIHI